MSPCFRFLRLAVYAIISAAGAVSAPPPMPVTPPGRLTFRTYDARDGLSNLAVWHLAQDSQGFVWTGTEAGLFRYDASHFQAFGAKEGLPSSDILVLHPAPSGELWVGTRLGLAHWNGRSFEVAPEFQGHSIQAVASSSGGLWVGTGQGGFLQGADGHFAKADGWPGGEVTALWGSGKSSQIWASSWDGKARVFSQKNGQWIAYEVPAGLEQERIDALAEDGQGRLWARSPRSLSVLEQGAQRFHQVTPPIPVTSDRGYLVAGHHGDIWVPTQQGLAHLEGNTWSVLTAKDGLPTPWCRTVMEDQEGSLWVGSVGVHRMLGRGVWRVYTQVDGLPSSVVWCVFRDQHEQLWVGTDKGLVRGTARGWEILPGTQGHVIRSVVHGRYGILYMAGVPGNEVLRYDPRTRVLDRLELSNGAAAKRIFRLLLDRSENLWVATDGAGLFRAATNGGRLKFERVELPNGTPTEYVGDVHQDSTGRIWVSGERGVAMLENGTWRRFTTKDGLKQDHVSTVRSLRDGSLLISFNEPLGDTLARYVGGKLEMLRQFDSESGLTENMVYLSGEDAKGRIWIGTGKGVDLVMPEGTDHFGVAEGMVGEDTDNMAFFAEPNGDVWVGTSTGLAHFNAKAYPGFVAPPASALLSMRLGKQEFIPGAKKAQVPFRLNTFEAHFACLSFLREDAVHQRVRLLGLETEWTPNDTNQSRYPALPHGHYRFEVSSRVGQGAWGPATFFEFEVLPAWWQTWWFRALYGLGAAGLVVLLVSWRMASLRDRNRILKEQVALRTKELEVANDALRNQSLTDPLTGLRNRRFLGECMPEDVALVNRIFHQANGPLKERLTLNIDLLFIMVDLDHFKNVNDEHGHVAGDLVLQQMGEIMKDATRDTDTVVRWGGEEFLVVARNVCRRDSTIMVERIRSQVAMRKFDIGDGKTLHLTCSLGFAFYPFIPEFPQSVTWERVVDAADHCLYAAKRSGRDAWVGLYPGDENGEYPNIDNHSLDVPELLANGTLQVKSCLPPGSPLDWDMKA